MKSLLAIPALVLAIGTQAALNPAYDKICPEKDGTRGTLPGGYEFTYQCGKTGKVPALYGTFIKSKTVEECAVACKESTNCMGSAWNPDLNICEVYDSAEPGVDLPHIIFLPTVNRGGPDCGNVEQELDKCKNNLKACQEKTCPETQILDDYHSAQKICEQDNGKTVDIDGVQYEISCNMQPYSSVKSDTRYTGDFDYCAGKCKEKGSACKGFMYYSQDIAQCVILFGLTDVTKPTSFSVITAEVV